MLAARSLKTGVEGRRLSLVPAQEERAQARVVRGQPSDQPVRAVAAAIVHQQDLVAHAGGPEHLDQLTGQRLQVVALVANRHHDRQRQLGVGTGCLW